MILQPCAVELTKVHYYDSKERNVSVSTASREAGENAFNRNVIIKRNVFGHRWVLKINEEAGGDEKKRARLRLVVYVLVSCSIVVALCFGVFFSIDKSLFQKDQKTIHFPHRNKTTKGVFFFKTHEDQVLKPSLSQDIKRSRNTTSNLPNNSTRRPFCASCDPRLEVCLKLQETERPGCVRIADENDPTGCGGLCPINTHFCRVLDLAGRVYQCSPLTNTLRCPDDAFNCGNRCISMGQRCDGVVDCSGYTDEKDCACNLETHFHCGNFTSCLENSKKCDQKVDCWDKSDEIGCSNAFKCENEEIPCLNGQCILKHHFCDGHIDCLDTSDEPDGCQA